MSSTELLTLVDVKIIFNLHSCIENWYFTAGMLKTFDKAILNYLKRFQDWADTSRNDVGWSQYVTVGIG